MAFHDIRFPTDAHIGTTVSASWRTSVVETDGEQEERFGRFSQPRWVFEVTKDKQDNTEQAELRTFFFARRGALHTFRFKYDFDYTSASDGTSTPTATDQRIGDGDNSTKNFQLTKTYTDSGGFTLTQNVTKPVSGTVVVSVNGSEAAATALGWSVDTSTGIVTFTNEPGFGDVVRAGFEYDFHVRFSERSDQSFDGTFESTVRADFRSIELVQVRDAETVRDDLEYGGSKDHGTLTADISLVASTARVHIVTDNTGFDSILPDPASLQDGAVLFVVRNEGSAAHEVVTHEATTIATLAGGSDETVEVDLARADDGTKTWYARKGA